MAKQFERQCGPTWFRCAQILDTEMNLQTLQGTRSRGSGEQLAEGGGEVEI